MQRPTQGSPSTSSTNSDFEAMKSAHTAAISANEKIFPVFAKKLASKDVKEYVTTTRKFTTWLGSEKAYYQAARPKIVELLEIAFSTFKETYVHHFAVKEFAELLRRLVQGVVPFIRLFSEPELQSRLQRVIMETEQSVSTVSTGATQGGVPPIGAATTNSPALPLALPVIVRPLPTMVPTLSPQIQTPTVLVQPSSVPGTAKAIPDGPVLARNPPEVAPGQTDSNPPLASPQGPGENVSPIPSKPQPKRARRAELSEELVARDLDWFRSRTNEDLSKTSESAPGPASDIPGCLPPPKKKTARIVPSRRLPRRVQLDAAQTAESDVPLPHPSKPSVEDASVQNVTTQQLFPEKTVIDVESSAIPEDRGMEVLPHEELPPPEPGSKPEPATISSNEPPVSPEIPHTNQQLPSTKSPILNGGSAISHHPSPSSPQTTLNKIQPMGISTSDDGSARLPSASSESTPPTSPQVFQLQSLVLPPLVGTLEPPLNLNFNILRTPSGQLQQSAIDANQRRFDGEMTVIHNIHGKPFTHTHMVDINLNESIFARISKWINRRSYPSEASHGVCISLACYHLPEFFDQIQSENDKPDIRVLTLHSSCSWPHSNRLSLHVNEETRHTNITLSPPLFLTSDQCVDISSLMKSGNNTLEIRQQGDLSEYLVVLHAHRPTQSQLAELHVVRTADERWRQFLDVLSAQAVPGRVLGATPVGVVGVF